MGKFIGYQFCGMVVIAAWTLVTNFFLFFAMKKAKILRVSLVHEIIGCDYTECGKPFPSFLIEKTESSQSTVKNGDVAKITPEGIKGEKDNDILKDF